MKLLDDDAPLRVYFAANMTPEKAVLVIQSLSRMVGVSLEIVSRPPDPGDPARVLVELREAARVTQRGVGRPLRARGRPVL